MGTIIKEDLFDTSATLYVLSSIMKNPLLLKNEKYKLTTDDFYKPLQKIIFGAVSNMSDTGMQDINPTSIDLYLTAYPTQYELYKKEKGFEYLLQCSQTVKDEDESQFEFYYNRLKKFSMLRNFKDGGFNISKIYNTNNVLNKEQEDNKLNSMSLKDISNFFTKEIVNIENKHIGKDEQTAQYAAQGLKELIENFEIEPEVGIPFDGDILNDATRGARLGKLYTYSSHTGGGKTRFMVGNACAISLPYLDASGKVVQREDRHYEKVVFVTTEQQVDEIQTMVAAYVSGISERKILLGRCNPEEKEKLNKAYQIMGSDEFKHNFLIECIPDPSIELLKARLIKFIVQDQIHYIFYDYIFTSPGLLKQFQTVREDVALMMLSNTLKEIAATYNVFIQSATQLNENWSKVMIGARDQNCLRGSKAIADKVDVGVIGVKLGEEEKKQIEALWSELCRAKKVDPTKEPNIVMDVYKNRRGELSAVKIFRYFDYGTCRCQDLFITDASYKTLSDYEHLQFGKEAVDFLTFLTKREVNS